MTARQVPYLQVVPDEAEVIEFPSDPNGLILREFVSAHLDLMLSVPDEERRDLAAKARRFGDAYTAIMQGLRR